MNKMHYFSIISIVTGIICIVIAKMQYDSGICKQGVYKSSDKCPPPDSVKWFAGIGTLFLIVGMTTGAIVLLRTSRNHRSLQSPGSPVVEFSFF